MKHLFNQVREWLTLEALYIAFKLAPDPSLLKKNIAIFLLENLKTEDYD